MKPDPSLSILMANYNNAAYIHAAVRSVICQENPLWQLLILDDASTDDSWNELLHYRSHQQIHLYKNDVNIGYIGSLKKLISLAPSQYIAILDSDDYLLPNAVMIVCNAFMHQSKPEFIYTRYIRVDIHGNALGEGFSRETPFGLSHLQSQCISHWKCFTKDLYERVGEYEPSMVFAEDYDLICKIEEHCQPFFINYPAYAYRVLADTQSNNPAKKALGLLNRSRAQLSAYRRRKAKNEPRNIGGIQLTINIFKTLLFGIFHKQWAGIYKLLSTVIHPN